MSAVTHAPQKRADLFGEAQTLTAYVEAYAAGDGSCVGPDLAAFTVDVAFVQLLSRLHEVCVAHDLKEVRVHGAPDWGPHGIEEELRLENHELVVTGQGNFWFEAVGKHADYHVESRLVGIGDLLAATEAALARGDDVVTDCGWSHEDADEVIATYREAKAAADTAFGMAP